jgi:ADP-heptose:LPS heptosyltransferase
MESKRILIYRRGGLGDTLLTFPVAEIFKRKGFEVHFVGNTDYLAIGKEAGFVDRSYSDFPRHLIKEGFFSKIVLFAKGNHLGEELRQVSPKVEVLTVDPFPPGRIHVTRYYLSDLNLEGETFSEVLPLGSAERKTPEGEKFILLHPGSGSEKKNAPLGLFKRLYRTFEEKHPLIKPLFVLGEAERSLARVELKGFKKMFIEDLVLFGRFLKDRVAAFVGNDSGITHLAGYTGVPTVPLFGPTDPVVWRPLGPKVEILYKGLPCSPCFPNRCKNRIYKECLDFKPQQVLNALSLLGVSL